MEEYQVRELGGGKPSHPVTTGIQLILNLLII